MTPRPTAAVLLLALGCAGLQHGLPGARGAQAISANRMLEHVRTLASDAFEGRAPGTSGEARTLEYLQRTLGALGLEPAPGASSLLQPVPLVGATVEAAALTVEACGQRQVWRAPGDAWVALRSRDAETLALQGLKLQLAGHGSTAPEYGWDDFEGVGLDGGVVLELPGEPPVADPEHPAQLDPRVFGGGALTRHAFGAAKTEAAARAGAVGRLVLYDEAWAGPRGWAGRRHLAVGEHLELAGPAPHPGVRFEGELGPQASAALLAACHLELPALRAAAARRGARPPVLEATVGVELRQRLRPVPSFNVLAMRRGSDPALAGEVVLYTAHWDHLGKDPTLRGDHIYNGARDNASGVAQLLEVAAAFAALPVAPRRSVLFLFTTGEEHGLLGARHYVASPAVPLAATRAVINLDMTNTVGPSRELGVAGTGPTELGERLAALARLQGRQVVVGTGRGEGLFFRSDQLPFAEAGVPVLFPTPGRRRLDTGGPLPDDGAGRHYHQVSDEIDPGWDLSGAALDARLLFALGFEVADEAPPGG